MTANGLVDPNARAIPRKTVRASRLSSRNLVRSDACKTGPTLRRWWLGS